MINKKEYEKSIEEFSIYYKSLNSYKDILKKHHHRELSKEEISISKDVFKTLKETTSCSILEMGKISEKLLYKKYDPNILYECINSEVFDFLMLSSEYYSKFNI